MRFSPKTVGLAAAVVTVVVWTSFIVVARAMALRSLTPMDIVLCRMLGASVVLLPWGWLMVRRMHAAQAPGPALGSAPPAPRTWLGLSPLPRATTVTVGIFGGVGYALLVYTGFVYAPAAHASVLLPGMLPMSTALLSVWLLRERLGRQRWLGLAVIFAGGMLVGGASLVHALSDSGSVWKGDVLFVCASTCWAFYAVTCRKHGLAAVPATIAVIVFCAISYVPVYTLLVWTGQVRSQLASAPWGEILFQAGWQGLGSVVISGITFTKMVQYFGPVRSTMLTALVPGLSALGAVVFLGEPLVWNLVLGLVLVTLGIVIGVAGPGQTLAATAAGAAPAAAAAAGANSHRAAPEPANFGQAKP